MHPGCQIEQVYLCRDPIDFRKAINGLSVLVEQSLGLNPFASALYVFVNRSRNKIKVLYWHRNGFCLWQKRLENEKFHWPPPPPAKPQIPARGKRSPLPAELERIEITHDVPEALRLCECGTPMVVINRVVSEQLDIIPMQVRVLQHIRLVYGCAASCHAPVTAILPPQPLPKSNASPGLLAMLLTTKYVDGLPLARFKKVLARHDVTVPSQTLARWVIGSGAALQPPHNLARDTLFEMIEAVTTKGAFAPFVVTAYRFY